MLTTCRKSCDVCPNPTPAPTQAPTQAPTPAPQPCTDDNQNCEYWASLGECEANPGYMLTTCRKSCDVCPNPTPAPTQAPTQAPTPAPQPCTDDNQDCEYWAN